MKILNTCKRQIESEETKFGFPARRQAGATLIEVMIAVLILAVGILGLMTLQINGKRATYQALQRGAATTLAWGYVDAHAHQSQYLCRAYVAD